MKRKLKAPLTMRGFFSFPEHLPIPPCQLVSPLQALQSLLKLLLCLLESPFLIHLSPSVKLPLGYQIRDSSASRQHSGDISSHPRSYT